MLVPDINAVHQIVPNLFIGGVSNRSLPPEEMIWFEARGISLPDKQTLDRELTVFAQTHNMQERMQEKERLDTALARSKWVRLHNYQVPMPDGGCREVTEFDDFCKVAPPELVAWYFDVIQWGEKLSAAERRNFLPPSASPSGPASGEQATAGSAATAMQTSGASATATT